MNEQTNMVLSLLPSRQARRKQGERELSGTKLKGCSQFKLILFNSSNRYLSNRPKRDQMSNRTL